MASDYVFKRVANISQQSQIPINTKPSKKKYLRFYAWLFGVILCGIGLLSLPSAPWAGVFLIIASAFLLPPVVELIQKKTGKSISRNARVVTAVVIAFIPMIYLLSTISSAPENTYQSAVVSSVTPTQISNHVSIVSATSTPIHVSTPTPVIQPPVSVTKWHTTLTYSNTTDIQTPPFTMYGSEWRVTYSCTSSAQAQHYGIGAQFYGYIYSTDDGTMVDQFASFVNCPHTDTSYMYSQIPGQYYLNLAQANGAYSVTVEDYY
jgi:hypothetical protein